MSTKTREILKSCTLALALAICFSHNPSLAVESEDKKQPVYGTCTPTNSGGQLQAAICLLKQLCPTCDFGTLSKNNIKIIADDHVVDRLFITTDRQQSYGLISAKGTVWATIMHGAISALCLKDSREVTLSGNRLDYRGCLEVAREGKPREFVYPPRFDELFKGAKFKLRDFASDPKEFRKLTVAELVLTESARICGNKFPKDTSFVYHTISTSIPYEVLLPDGATLADGRKPNENQTIDLTDDKFNCAISIREKIVENGDWRIVQRR